MIATSIPFVHVESFGLPIQPFGVLVLLGVGLGVVAAWRLSVRFNVRGWGLLPIAIPIAFAFSHWFDVVAIQWSEATQRPLLWVQFMNGMHAIGGFVGVALWTLIVAHKRPDRARIADIAAVSTLVSLTVGRIGCALVHDHLGKPTSSPFGVDVPEQFAWPKLLDDYGKPLLRRHDLGVEELILLVPFLVALFILIGRVRAGLVAVIAAIGYACIRFPLDFHRLEQTDPRQLGLTGAQWGCLGMIACGAIGLVLVRKR